MLQNRRQLGKATAPFCNILLPCLDGSCCFFLLCNFSVMGLAATFPFVNFPSYRTITNHEFQFCRNHIGRHRSQQPQHNNKRWLDMSYSGGSLESQGLASWHCKFLVVCLLCSWPLSKLYRLCYIKLTSQHDLQSLIQLIEEVLLH